MLGYSLLTFGIIFLVYTLYEIYIEFNNTPMQTVQIFGFTLKTPAWWYYNCDEHTFTRKDDNYDWFAKIWPMPENQTPMEFFSVNNLIFDPEEFYEKNLKSYLYIQGTCTDTSAQDEKRCYWEGVFFKSKNGENFVFYSKSSILSGGIEGPFFERVAFELISAL